MRRPAVFLDRDGTLNREVGFVASVAELEPLPGVGPALARLAALGLRLVVVTNQSGIARGLYGEHDLARIHEALQDATGRRIDAFVHCPHHPDQPPPYGRACACRKPGPGLVNQAAELLALRYEGSYVVGDSARDLLATAGLPIRRILVRSGKPIAGELERIREGGLEPDAIVADLPAAAEWIEEDLHP